MSIVRELVGHRPSMPNFWDHDPDVQAARGHQHDRAATIQKLTLRQDRRQDDTADRLRRLQDELDTLARRREGGDGDG